jgi:hypothetical protein
MLSFLGLRILPRRVRGRESSARSTPPYYRARNSSGAHQHDSAAKPLSSMITYLCLRRKGRTMGGIVASTKNEADATGSYCGRPPPRARGRGGRAPLFDTSSELSASK